MWKLTLSFITNLSRIHVCIYFDVWPWCEQMWSSLSTSNNRFELRWYTPGMQANLKRSKTFSYQLKILNKIIFTQIISISKKNPDFWPVSRNLQTYLTSNEFQNFCKTFAKLLQNFCANNCYLSKIPIVFRTLRICACPGQASTLWIRRPFPALPCPHSTRLVLRNTVTNLKLLWW